MFGTVESQVRFVWIIFLKRGSLSFLYSRGLDEVCLKFETPKREISFALYSRTLTMVH